MCGKKKDALKRSQEELGLPYDQKFLVGCRYNEQQKNILVNKAEEIGFDVLGFLPPDREIAEKNLAGESLLTLSPGNPARKAAEEMLGRILSQI